MESNYLQTYFHLPIVLTPPNQGGNLTVAVGDSFNLTCAGENHLTRQWLTRNISSFRQSVVANTSDGRIVVTEDEMVLFRGIQPGDEALYMCVLRNDINIETIVVNVTVVGKWNERKFVHG